MPETGKVKNISGEGLIDAWSGGRLVLDGQVLEVPLDQVHAYTQQAERWAPHDAPAKKAHKDAADAIDAAQAAETAAYEARFGKNVVDDADPDTTPEPEPDPTPAVPGTPQED